MKRIFSFLLLVFVIGKTATAQTLSVPDVEVVPGATAYYSLNINVEGGDYKGFFYDIQFPTGISTPTAPNSTVHPSWNGGTIVPGDRHLVAISLSNTSMPTGDIEIGTAAFTVADNVELGEYDVTISNIVFMISSSESVTLPNPVTFKVKVVDVLSVVLDENSTTPPPGHFYGNVRVKRTINANEWSTICLPFDMDEEELKAAFGDDVKLYTFEGCETTMNGSDVVGIKVNFEPTTYLSTNWPYVIKVSRPITEFSVENRSFKTGHVLSRQDYKRIGTTVLYNTFNGTYVAETTVPNLCLFLSGGKFYYSTGQTKMKGFRCYFDFYDVLSEVDNMTAGAKISLSIGDETTGVESVECRTDSSEGWYTLDGIKLNGEPTKKGIYIYNGKKVVKK